MDGQVPLPPSGSVPGSSLSAVKTLLRLRPRLATDGNDPHVKILSPSPPGSLPTSVEAVPPETPRSSYRFCAILDENASQAQVFQNIRPLLDRVLDNFNATIFAYGTTSTGKTYTMEGGRLLNGKLDPETKGLIPLSIRYLIEHSQDDVIIRVSALELDGTEAYDLFEANENENRSDAAAAASSSEQATTIPSATTTASVGLSMLEIADPGTLLRSSLSASASSSTGRGRSSLSTPSGSVSTTPRIPARSSRRSNTSTNTNTGGGGISRRGTLSRFDPRSPTRMVPATRQRQRNRKKVHIYEIDGEIFVRGHREVQIRRGSLMRDIDQVLGVIATKRKQFSTRTNPCSSRSHVVVTISVLKRSGQEDGPTPASFVTTAKLNLVDLAGSENIRRAERSERSGVAVGPGAGAGPSDTGRINESLLGLGRVFEALNRNALRARNKKPEYVPYRASKLTQLLKDSFGGGSHCMMIATIGRYRLREECLQTLRRTAEFQSIINRPKRNRRIQLSPGGSLICVPSELSRLREDLERSLEQNELLRSRNRNLRRQLVPIGKNLGSTVDQNIGISKSLLGAFSDDSLDLVDADFRTNVRDFSSLPPLPPPQFSVDLAKFGEGIRSEVEDPLDEIQSSIVAHSDGLKERRTRQTERINEFGSAFGTQSKATEGLLSCMENGLQRASVDPKTTYDSLNALDAAFREEELAFRSDELARKKQAAIDAIEEDSAADKEALRSNIDSVIGLAKADLDRKLESAKTDLDKKLESAKTVLRQQAEAILEKNRKNRIRIAEMDYRADERFRAGPVMDRFRLRTNLLRDDRAQHEKQRARSARKVTELTESFSKQKDLCSDFESDLLLLQEPVPTAVSLPAAIGPRVTKMRSHLTTGFSDLQRQCRTHEANLEETRRLHRTTQESLLRTGTAAADQLKSLRSSTKTQLEAQLELHTKCATFAGEVSQLSQKREGGYSSTPFRQPSFDPAAAVGLDEENEEEEDETESQWIGGSRRRKRKRQAALGKDPDELASETRNGKRRKVEK